MKSNGIESLKRSGGGFTLIELLLVIAMIAVLAALSLAVIGDAQYDSLRNATRARIWQIDRMLVSRLEAYQVRRIPLRSLQEYVGGNNPAATARILKRRILAEIIRAEMPQDTNDFVGASGTVVFPSQNFRNWAMANNDLVVSARTGNPVWIDLATQVPALALRYGTSPPFPNDKGELLYAILATTEFNGIQAVTALGSSAFDDADADGFLEVVDFWGNPITFEIFGLVAADDFDVNNLRIVLTSGGDGREPIDNLSN